MDCFKRRKNKKSNIGALRRESETDIHTIDLRELLSNLGTSISTGLRTQQAKEIFQEQGPNSLTSSTKTHELIRIIHCCFGGFAILIWIGAMLCFGSYALELYFYPDPKADHFWLGIFLVVLTLVTGVFNYYQESKSSRIMESFQQMLPLKAKVIRDAERRDIYVTELVVGDIVLLETGDRVPADIRILECQGLKVDNASITGESLPLSRTIRASSGPILEAKNMAFFATSVVEGTGKGVVVACGDRTIMGRVAKLTAKLKPRPTPLARNIKKFMRNISCWATFLGITFFVLSISFGYTMVESLIFLIGTIVANVPEGLIATVTVSLTLTAKRMAYKNCLVRNLKSVETLGCTAVICSDKTGTLTQNKMTVRHMWYDGHLKEVMASDTWRKYERSFGFRDLALVATLCNRAEWLPMKTGDARLNTPLRRRKMKGDASDKALLRCMEVLVKGGTNQLRRIYPKVLEIPFNSTEKFQANVHRKDNRYVVLMKGAPERVLERCSHVAYAGETRILDQEIREACMASCHILANNGERVLGFADLELSPTRYPKDYKFNADLLNFPLQNLRLVGLISMMDPPRPTVPDAVFNCRQAGIKVIMVTGDHPDTARAIAKYVNIITEDAHENNENAGKQSIVVTGTELYNLQPKELDNLIRSYPEIVFARTSPMQKLQIVESCQRLNLITAATGDGVNDAPALKQADIGIAMGISGSDVSRQVADMVLLDDNFSTIVTGIEEGRRVFDNLKSSIAYTLASNVPEITPFLAFIVLGIPLPVGIICVLCIDIGTDMWPAISLAYEKSESDIMKRSPRIPHVDTLVSRKLVFTSYGQIGIIEAFAGFAAYFTVMAENGFLPGKLLGIRSSWDNHTIDSITDSFGKKWTYDDRKVLEYTCHTAFFVAIVIVQVADVIVCKTRRVSVFTQGMNNWALNLGILFEFVMACIVCYVPYMDVILKTYPLKAGWWLPAIPYACLILIYSELRKWWIRRNPGGWFDRKTAF